MFRTMPNNKKNPKSRIPSIEETNAELEKDFAQQDPKAKDLPPKEDDSKALDESMQSCSVAAEKAEETVPEGTTIWSDGRPLREPEGTYFPADSHETDCLGIFSKHFSQKCYTFKKVPKRHFGTKIAFGIIFIMCIQHFRMCIQHFKILGAHFKMLDAHYKNVECTL